MANSVYAPSSSSYIPVLIAGRVAFRFDHKRGIVELKSHGTYYYVDLALEVEKYLKEHNREVIDKMA